MPGAIAFSRISEPPNRCTERSANIAPDSHPLAAAVCLPHAQSDRATRVGYTGDTGPDFCTNTHAIGSANATSDIDAKLSADDCTDAQPVDGTYASALDLTNIDPTR